MAESVAIFMTNCRALHTGAPRQLRENRQITRLLGTEPRAAEYGRQIRTGTRLCRVSGFATVFQSYRGTFDLALSGRPLQYARMSGT
jgi:hypothetical protein